MKILKTVLICLVLVFAGTLWATRLEDLQSQSAFALAPNAIWYYLMHFAIIATFVSDWWTHKSRWLNFAPALGSTLVLLWDMYNFPVLHNWATALTMAGAVSSLIVYAASQQERIYVIVACVIGAVMFPLGMFTNVSLFFTEVVAETMIGVGMARRFWVEDYN